MADKTTPTPGPWEVGTHPVRRDLHIIKPVMMGNRVEKLPECEGAHAGLRSQEDAHLIAAAGTAAHEVAQMGYDPVEAVRALPTIIRDLSDDTDHGWVRDWIASAARKEDDDDQ